MDKQAFLTPLSHGFAAAALLAASLGAQASVITFDDPVLTAPTQAPGFWYTDRYAPAGFTNGTLGGENVLKQSISAADGASSRPGSFSDPFYNTQGRKLDAPTGTTSISIDLWLDSTWTDSSRRYAGLWGTAFNAADAISFYPIAEFGMGQLRVWNNGVWIDTGVAPVLDSWVNLSASLVGGNWEYAVDGTTVATVSALGSVRIGNTILQGYNTTAGVSYDIHWDNLSFGSGAAVPAPGGLALVGLGLLALAATRRRQA